MPSNNAQLYAFTYIKCHRLTTFFTEKYTFRRKHRWLLHISTQYFR